MHERTQRAVARLLFLFCCALPTGLTFTCVLATSTSWYHDRVLRETEDRLSRECGMTVRVGELVRLGPHSVELHEVCIYEPETQGEVAKIRQVRWASREDGDSVVLDQPVVQSSQLPAAWRLIHERFLCRPERTSEPFFFSSNQLRVESPSGSITLRDVDAWVQPKWNNLGVEATIQCIVDDLHSDDPVTITASRDRRSANPRTDWLLQSGRTALPCSVLSEYLPPLQSLGQDATFEGTMQWRGRGDQFYVDLGGSRFAQVDLAQLMDDEGSSVTGIAEIELTRCMIDRDEDLIDVEGSIRAKDGRISPHLLHAMQTHLGVRLTTPPAPNHTHYDRLATSFTIHNSQLQLHGICRRESGFDRLPVGVVLCADQAIAFSSDRTFSSVALAHLLAPPHSVSVPLARQTERLLRLLVLPRRAATTDAVPDADRRRVSGGDQRR